MNFKQILDQFNIKAQCQKYRLPLWQCPQFLFLIMGIFIICTVLLVYYLGIHYGQDPQVIVLAILFLTALLLIVAFSIAQGFERLAEANRMKSEFISVVSHQLRSPLSNVRWATEFLASGRAGSLREKQLDYFRILKENAKRMGELVNDLLIVSRIEEGKLPLKKEMISLPEIIESLILEFKPLAEASNVIVEFEKKGKIPEVLGDLSQIKLVIENLLDNAIRYSFSKKEKGRVKIKLEITDKRLYFEIKDNGVGIPKEDQQYIFQKFFRSENILRYQTQGSGLGLFISKSIIERSGGKMGFRSREGRGSTFWFTLPIR